MPDEAAGGSVEQDSIEQSPPVETINPPSPPNDIADQAAESVSTPDSKDIQSLKNELKTAEKWIIWLTGAIAFFALGTVIAGFLQWNAMRGQLTEMKNGSVDTGHLVEATQKQAAANIQQVGSFAALAIAAKKQSDDTAALTTSASNQVKQLQGLVSATIAQNGVLSDQLQTMQDQTETNQRPWISISDPVHPDKDFPMIFANGAISMTIRLKIKNVGKSPASQVIVKAEMHILGNFIAGAKKTCEDGFKDQDFGSASIGRSGYMIFSDQESEWKIGANNPPDEIATIQRFRPLPSGDYPTPQQIVGCIVYSSPAFPNRSYYTTFAYLIGIPTAGVEQRVSLGVAGRRELPTNDIWFGAIPEGWTAK